MIARKIDLDQLLTSTEVSELLQVNPSSINNWVNEGRITAFRTPGGHRRIRARDLIEFLESHKIPIPARLAPGRRRLLVVDDDQSHLRALQRLFKPYLDRVEVTLTTNGIDALLQIGALRPHLIVLDVFMPGLDGLEVTRRLKANPETRKIDVIVTSGHLKPQLVEKALAAGALRCVAKPFDLAMVLETLGVSVHTEN